MQIYAFGLSQPSLKIHGLQDFAARGRTYLIKKMVTRIRFNQRNASAPTTPGYF